MRIATSDELRGEAIANARKRQRKQDDTEDEFMDLTKEQAREIWSILVDRAGALLDEESDFVRLATKSTNLEYRFGGTLGFGAKVYLEEPPRVAYYQEDASYPRSKMQAQANKALRELYWKWLVDAKKAEEENA